MEQNGKSICFGHVVDKDDNTHRIHGAAIYGVPWIPSIYPQSMLAYIPTPAGSVMGMMMFTNNVSIL